MSNCPRCQIVLLAWSVSNCPILYDGVKLSAVSNCPSVKLSSFVLVVSNCPFCYDGVKLSLMSHWPILFGWCQIVLGVKLSQMIALAIHCVELLPECLFRLTI